MEGTPTLAKSGIRPLTGPLFLDTTDVVGAGLLAIGARAATDREGYDTDMAMIFIGRRFSLLAFSRPFGSTEAGARENYRLGVISGR